MKGIFANKPSQLIVCTAIFFFCLSLQAEASWLPAWLTKKPATAETPPPVQPERKITPQASFQASMAEMADQLFANLEDKDPQTGTLADGLAFAVFVDLKKLTRTSSFGRYLAEQLMGEFQQQGYPVLEIRKSHSIMVSERRGEYGLSRDLAEINDELTARTLLTGTYTQAGDHIMVNAKIIDNKTAEMLSSATVLFARNSLSESLLADAASAKPPRKTAYVYMKKLEL